MGRLQQAAARSRVGNSNGNGGVTTKSNKSTTVVTQITSLEPAPDLYKWEIFNKDLPPINDMYYTPVDKMTQHTHFGFQDIDITVPPVSWGEEVEVAVPFHGDLLSTCWLCIDLPMMSVDNCYWMNLIGQYIVDSVELVVDNVVLATHTYSHSMFISALDIKRRNYSKLVTPPLSSPKRDPRSAYDTMYVKLDFWFCKSYYNTLPLMLLQGSSIKFRIKLAGAPTLLDPSGLSAYTRIIGEGDNRFQTRNKSPYTKQALLDFALHRRPKLKLRGRYIHLHTIERKGMANPSTTLTWTFSNVLDTFYTGQENIQMPVLSNTHVKEIAFLFYTNFDHTGYSSSYDPFNQVYVNAATDPWGKAYYVWDDGRITDGNELNVREYRYQAPMSATPYTKHTVEYKYAGVQIRDPGFYYVHRLDATSEGEIVTLVHATTGNIIVFNNATVAPLPSTNLVSFDADHSHEAFTPGPNNDSLNVDVNANGSPLSECFFRMIQIKDNDGTEDIHDARHRVLDPTATPNPDPTTDESEATYTFSQKIAGDVQIFTQDLSRVDGVWQVDSGARWFVVAHLTPPVQSNGGDTRETPNGYYSIENLEDNQVGAKIHLKKLDAPYLHSRHTILNVRVPFDDDVSIMLTSNSAQLGPYPLSHLGRVGDGHDTRSAMPRQYHHTMHRTRLSRSSGRHDQQVLFSDDNTRQRYPAHFRESITNHNALSEGLTTDSVENPNSLEHYNNRCVTHGRTRQRTRNPFVQSPANLELFRLKFALDAGSNDPTGYITFNNQWTLNVISAKKKKYNLHMFFNIFETMIVSNGQLKYVPMAIG